MESWYKVATPRREVRECRSFNPDEFAIALERVAAGTAPEDDRDPRLANAFSALHPKGSEGKRRLDAMLMAMPR